MLILRPGLIVKRADCDALVQLTTPAKRDGWWNAVQVVAGVIVDRGEVPERWILSCCLKWRPR